MTPAERGIWLDDPTHRNDLAAFTERLLRLDHAAIIRFRQRTDQHIMAWAATGFDVLAGRVVGGRIKPVDLAVGADALAAGLVAMTPDGHIEPGFAMDSAWRGALPPETGFVHLDDVPARVVLELAERGGALAKQHSSAHGPPVSLLDQDVMAVSSGDQTVDIPMRCVFALTAMGFVPQPIGGDEVVRVRVHPTWLRIDARFGSVYRRRGAPEVVLS
ncbi:hypothetical protein H7I53_22735 [Mycolicibacterium pulveris]|uniref:Uncharacterized protein n=1 Tax=Mycolicibacterium pulveris TaxID=36813 RepID=A0A7I7UQP5_MYCPV|nr:hypothetical protein [Mycolicibacterium pulveris]MCV6983025.1 hypothetical protein [Mycolicibacterium pulveris]BBY82889.1 hypothetical protein MPUL_40470 [Mycolicibacterium pulveris]